MARPVRIAEKPPRFSVPVQSVDALGDEVYRVRLDPHPMPWVPGDCVTLHAPAVEEGRPYSLSGAADAPFMEFWIRRFPDGEVSRFVTDQRVGDLVEVSPPFGWFRPCEPREAAKIYIATGTGIAPFLSALSTDAQGVQSILWGLRKPLPVPEELRSRVLEICVSGNEPTKGRRGRVTDVVPEIDINSTPHFYLCGLDAMIEEVTTMLKARGVPDSRIHTECFFTASSSSS